MAWPNSTRGTIPRSICSEPCPNGFIRNFQVSVTHAIIPLTAPRAWGDNFKIQISSFFLPSSSQDQCCWSCVSCREDSYSFNDTCVACDAGFAPNRDHSGCTKIPAEHLTWDSPWAIVPLVFSALGVAATVFILVVFLRYNSTPLIMASGRELCYLLLTGILSCYLMAIPILAMPSLLTCSALRIGLGFSLCLCYSSILTKTNRISRIFNRGAKAGIKRPRYTSPKSQIVICCG